MRWVRVSKAARELDVSPAAVIRMATAGKLPSRKTRRGVEVQLDRWLARGGYHAGRSEHVTRRSSRMNQRSYWGS